MGKPGKPIDITIKSKKRKALAKVPSIAVASPYFGLERHIEPPVPTKRARNNQKKQLLEQIHWSGRVFADTISVTKYTSPPRPPAQTSGHEVDATDMFKNRMLFADYELEPSQPKSQKNCSEDEDMIFQAQSQLGSTDPNQEEASNASASRTNDVSHPTRERNPSKHIDTCSTASQSSDTIEGQETGLPPRPTSPTGDTLSSDMLDLDAQGSTPNIPSSGMLAPPILDPDTQDDTLRNIDVFRNHSLTQDDRAFRDQVWKELPIFTSARVLAQRFRERHQGRQADTAET
jgi:hypothetical protein